MQIDDEVFMVRREFNDGTIMAKTFDSLEKAIEFKDKYSDPNFLHDDRDTLETTTLVSTVSEMIDLIAKYEKHTFELMRQNRTEQGRTWTALGAFNKIRDEWLDESKYTIPAFVFLASITWLEDFILANEYIWGFAWAGVSYALYKVQKFFIHRKNRSTFVDF